MLARIRNRAGATLLEVMVALGILATAYVALMETQSGSIRLSTYGKQLTVATFLAQSKMEEIEEKLIKDGFPDMDESEDCDFDELGYPSFGCKVEIKKVELPLGAAFNYLLQSFGGKEGEEGAGGLAGMLGNLGESSGQIAEMLKGVKGGAGGMGAAASLLNPDMLKGNVDMLSDMLEQAIREVRLTVFWGGGKEDEQVVITNHLVMVPQASAAAGATPLTGAGAQTGAGLPGVKGPLPPGLPGKGGGRVQPPGGGLK